MNAAPEARFGAPTVSGGRNLDTYGDRPCSLLTAADLESLGVAPQTARQENYAQALNCTWDANSDGDPPSLTITTSPGRNLLVDAYRTRAMPIFTPTSVAGLPATTETSTSGDFVCFATVAVNEHDSVASVWFAKQPLDPPTEACDNATKALAAVVAHLPPR